MITLLGQVGSVMIVGEDDGAVRIVDYDKFDGELDHPNLVSKEEAKNGYISEPIDDGGSLYFSKGVRLVQLCEWRYQIGDTEICIVIGKGHKGWYLEQ